MFKAPIIIGDQPVSAVIDTGASHSIIDEDFARQANIPYSPHTQPVSLASRDGTATTSGVTFPLLCSSGKFNACSSFYVMPLQPPTKCLLGRDLFHPLGVHRLLTNDSKIQTLDVSSVSSPTTSPSTQDPGQDPDAQPKYSTAIPKEVQDLLDSNISLSETQRCTHPDAMIS